MKKDSNPIMDQEMKERADSDQEMLNLENELYSLTHYVDDEEELVAQMFASIKGSKLESMMPPILKEIPLIDVQQLCLHELRGMSQRRILSIINGQEMSGSSSEEEDSSDEKDDKSRNEAPKPGSTKALLAEAEEALVNGDEAANLTAMDLLELEMRAKLIKTMLEKQGDSRVKKERLSDSELGIGNGYVPDIKIKQEPLSSDSSRSRSRSSYTYSSSYSSSYSSRSRSSSRGKKTSRRKRRGKVDSVSPESKKQASKKKLTKREFEDRMKKAKLNRKYRERKASDDESGNERSRRRRKKSRSLSDEENLSDLESSRENVKDSQADQQEDAEEHPNLKDEELLEGTGKEEKALVDSSQAIIEEEGEIDEPEDGELEEREEGELDSNEEAEMSVDEFGRNKSLRKKKRTSKKTSASSDSHSRSHSNASYDGSRSPSRRRSKKKRSKKNRRRRRRSSTVENEKPKIPNWNSDQDGSNLPGKRNADPTNSDEEFSCRDAIELNLPAREERQTISFSINKKSAPTKTNSELDDEDLPSSTAKAESEKVGIDEDFYKGSKEIGFVDTVEALSEPNNFGNDQTSMELIESSTNEESLADDKQISTEGIEEAMEQSSIVDLDERSIDKDDLPEKEADQEMEEEDSQDAEPEMEIIGTIDPKENEGFIPDEDIAGGSSWSARWLQSEKVQKVVSNSKMLSKVRKNIQAKGKKAPMETPKQHMTSTSSETKPNEPQKIPTKPQKTSTGVIGSMEEYEKMFGIKVKAPTSLPQSKAAPAQKQQSTGSSQSLAPGLLDSGDEEDSEEEAIWSKIMQK